MKNDNDLLADMPVWNAFFRLAIPAVAAQLINVALYGKENWALSTYEGNVSLINNYILPIIGDAKLSEINTRFIERYPSHVPCDLVSCLVLPGIV